MELSPDEYRIETVFLVVFFLDDMIVQLYEADRSSTLVHIRSASRVGYSDIGVNTRRVRYFLKLMKRKLILLIQT
ncbi:MAG: DUF1499 domain-containing protein [Balneolaceae bacterium]|nr:DUF1499 domain-containing protein [Balneolaceae bacterium]